MKIDVTKENSIVVVAVEGEIDVETAPELRECFDRLLAEGEHSYAIDMAGVEFIDSSGLGVLVAAHRRLTAAGGRIALASATPALRKVFQLTRTNRLFKLYDAVSDAIADMSD